MTEQTSRLGRLVEGLYESTLEKRVTWAESGEKQKYQTRLGTYVVTVSSQWDDEADDTYPEIEIRSLGGKVLDKVYPSLIDEDKSPQYGEKWYVLMEKIISSARRNALGVDVALDEILGLLGKS